MRAERLARALEEHPDWGFLDCLPPEFVANLAAAGLASLLHRREAAERGGDPEKARAIDAQIDGFRAFYRLVVG